MNGLSTRAKATGLAFATMVERWSRDAASAHATGPDAAADLVRPRAAGERHGRVPSRGRRGLDHAEGEDRVANLDWLIGARRFVPPELAAADRVLDLLAAWLGSCW
ncbi:MAG: hypothetical protein U0575_03195 [Phycisphaerales bacterium]